MTYEIKPNEQFKSLEIYFSDKPETATREALKALRFRWNPKKSCWYGFADLATLSETLENVTGKKPEENAVVIPEASFVDGGGLYDGWEGGNHCNWNTTKELKEQLKAAFKKCGLKVTIREGGGTWKGLYRGIAERDSWQRQCGNACNGVLSVYDYRGRGQEDFSDTSAQYRGSQRKPGQETENQGHRGVVGPHHQQYGEQRHLCHEADGWHAYLRPLAGDARNPAGDPVRSPCAGRKLCQVRNC